MKVTTLLLAALNFLLPTACLLLDNNDESTTVSFHGSGTSNPDRCILHVLESMEAQTKIPIRATYRSTSSGPGQAELIGNVSHPYNHYASSDYPLSEDNYNHLTGEGHEVVHLPVLMGAIGIFHSVPLQQADISAQMNLNLTSCLVARIFRRNITDWKHPDIVEINPSMDIPIQVDAYGNPLEDQEFPVKISHRTLGSSSTFAFTTYLHKSCPQRWGEELVGSEIVWPEGPNSLQASGTSAMIENIQNEVGTIGYADSGLALDQGVDEVGLMMAHAELKEDYYLTSKTAIEKGGILAALNSNNAGIPASSDADWSRVDLINQVEGFLYTWPMVLMSYIVVRKDLPSFLPNPRAQSLLVRFLKNMYNPLYVNKCADDFEFVTVTWDLRDMALEGIDMLEVSPDAPEWILESTEILLEGGQDDYVISTHRKRGWFVVD